MCFRERSGLRTLDDGLRLVVAESLINRLEDEGESIRLLLIHEFILSAYGGDNDDRR